VNNYHSYELFDSIRALVAMIPDELRDEQFIEELDNAQEDIYHAVFDLLRRKGMLMKPVSKR